MAYESKGLSWESIKPTTTSNNSLNSEVNYIGNDKIPVKFGESCVNQEKVTLTRKQVIII